MARNGRRRLVTKYEEVDRGTLARELRELQKELHAARRVQEGANGQVKPEEFRWMDAAEDYDG